MDAPRHAPPWLFGLTAIPYGIAGGFCSGPLPFLTSKVGFSMDKIGWLVTATLVPPMVQFLYAPIIDIGPKRKHWLVIVSALGAACLCAALMMPLPSRVGAFLALVVAGQLISGLVGSCNGGLLASTMPDKLRGAAGGWLNAGNLGGAALCTAVTIYMINMGVARLTLGLTVAAMMIIPSLAALTIDEEDRLKVSPHGIFGTALRGVWTVARSRPGWTGILFCLSPVGSAALVNFFSGMAGDYHASDQMVAFVNGPVSGLLTAGGSLIGGYLCDRMNRRVAYLMAGGLSAVAGLLMSFAPLSATTYAVGVSAYLFIAGFCYSAYSAVVLEAIGKAGAAAATQYTLFSAAGNAAIGYVGWIDTRFSKRGPSGILRADAALNLIGIVALSLMIALVYKKRPDEAPKQAAA